MNPNLFFDSKQIIRERNFFFTYSAGNDLEGTIAYANDLNSLNIINKIASISAVITNEELIEKVTETKGVIVSKNLELLT